MVSALILSAVVGMVPSPERANVRADSLNAGGSFVPATRGVSFSENFDGFALGSGIQNGWTGFFGAPSDGFNIVSTGFAGFGAASAQHNADASGFAGYEISSPVFAAETGGLFADVIMNPGAAASLYQFVTVGNVNTFNTRINFEADGTINALQAVGGVGAFQPTTGTWSAGVATRLGVVVPGDGTLQIIQDGNVIFTGIDIPFALGNASTGVQQFRVYSANTVAGVGANFIVDNINSTVPAPGALALGGLGLLAAARRRRA